MTDATLFGAFWGSLGATVVALGAVLWFAHHHRVQAHLTAVTTFVVVLLVTLVFAELIGQRFDFDPTAKHVHLPLAFLTTGVLFAPLITGFRHWQGKGALETHRRCVAVFLGLVVLTIGTGVWMLSTRRPPERPASAGPVELLVPTG